VSSSQYRSARRERDGGQEAALGISWGWSFCAVDRQGRTAVRRLLLAVIRQYRPDPAA